jgi:hypothetical protein
VVEHFGSRSCFSSGAPNIFPCHQPVGRSVFCRAFVEVVCVLHCLIGFLRVASSHGDAAASLCGPRAGQ